MEKLKTRLDAFSDAIIAIIITIMVLNIPPVLHDNLNNYLALGKSVGIFLISFLFVANMWYQHATAFAEIETITYRILLLDLIFLAPLSLMPLMTDMMAINTTRWSVLLYGGLQLLVNLLFRLLARAIIHHEYTDRAEMKRVYTKIYGDANLALSGWSAIALVVAYFQPHIAMLFYLAYPILMFVLSADARQQLSDAASLPAEQQKDYESLSAAGRRDFRKAHQAIMTGTPPTAAQPSAEPLPRNWSNWLDQNVDPKRRQMIRTRFAQSSPEQQAEMRRWFEAYKHLHAKHQRQ
ncbi:TMEM175 family protein [Lacticaseibacillus absianus]|uniref:TMEM175 family protein n=1 Tax=Lacticaseibacillus absianus TaxID=2729623 RepID=UPI0015CB1F38|nr:TMEM175 family protein [Lacticaseibacillus absianus]